MDPLPAELLFVFPFPDDDTESAPADPIGLEWPDPDVLGRWARREGPEDSTGCIWCSMPDGEHEPTCRRGVR